MTRDELFSCVVGLSERYREIAEESDDPKDTAISICLALASHTVFLTHEEAIEVIDGLRRLGGRFDVERN